MIKSILCDILPIVLVNTQEYVPPSDLCKFLISTSVLSCDIVTRDEDLSSMLSFVQSPKGSGVPVTSQNSVIVAPCCFLYLLGVLSVIFGGATKIYNL